MGLRTLITIGVALTFALTGCGRPSGSTPPKSSPPPAADAKRITVAQLAQAFIDWDGVKTHAIKIDDGCDRLAIQETGKLYYPAVVIASPSDACDTTMSIEEGANSMHIDRNVWIEWPDGTDSATRSFVQTSAIAAFVTLTT